MQRGVHVVMGDIDGGAAADEASALGAGCMGIQCDVADPAAVARLTDAAVATHGQIDLLINNAGVGGVLGPAWDSHPHDWRWVMDVNVMGVVHGVQSVLPHMLRRGRGHVVNLSSMAGLATPPFMSPYAASKHAVIGLSESLAAELAIIGADIGVSVVCPGVVESRIKDSDRNRPASLRHDKVGPPEMIARIRAEFDRITADPMKADEAAETILSGVEAGRLHILTHPHDRAAVLARFAQIERSLDGTPGGGLADGRS
ncbi:1-deoxy-11-beta-hydroxypentalenate dehydrogenase [compost metagenome]